MNAIIKKSNIKGEIVAPPSKSYAHRLLICAFLSKKSCVVENIELSSDVTATLGILKELGANFEILDDKVAFYTPKCVDCENLILNAVESGSTLRFFLPICASLGKKATFIGSKRLMERPIDDLADCLNEHGAKISGFTVNGKLQAGKYVINATLSSQYVSGLLFALSTLDGVSEIIVEGKKTSVNYVDMTVNALSLFGIKIEKTNQGYKIWGNTFKQVEKVVVEGDYSNSAFFLCLGALGGDILIKGLNKNSLQGDREIINVLKKFGANIYWQNGDLKVEKSRLDGITVDIENIPDLAQIIAVVGAFSNGKTTLKNVERLRIKESDRAKGIVDTLSQAGAQVELDNNQITILGTTPKCAVFDGKNDHRTVMSSAVLALLVDGESKIIGAEAVNKSYPTFFEKVKSLGGEINVDI